MDGYINGITSDEILSILNDDWHRFISLIFKLRIKDWKKVYSLKVKLKEMERENKIQTKVLYGKTYWRKLKNE